MDLEDLRHAVTIPDALLAAGIELPHRGRRIACPLHAGENSTAFKFDDRRFRCFACGAHGDVFDLVQALSGCTLRTAVERVAVLAGGAGAMAQGPSSESRQRAVRRRRRATLLSWHAQQRAIAVAVRSRRRQEARRAAAAMVRARDQQNPDTPAWDELERAHCALDAAEREVTRLEPESYEPSDIQWLVGLWLDEQSARGGATGAEALGS